MEKLSAVIITKNEERNIERCLRSVSWVDEIVVVDSGSQDRTLDICRQFGCKIIETEWLGFGPTKQHAVNAATHDWVLSIDADEEVTPELQEEIKTVLQQNQHMNGYRIRWLSYYIKKWVRYSGWNKQYKLKLFNRQYGHFNDSLIHEKVVLEGPGAKLKHVLKHHTYPDLATFTRKMDSYAEMGARMLYEKGKEGSLWSAYLHGMATFIKMYFLQLGFLDGKVGLILASNYAFAVYYKYLKLWEMTTPAQKQ